MTVQHLQDLKKPIGDILKDIGPEGVLLESSQARYAVIPLDDDLIDYLLERSPKLAEECKRIRERMKAGGFKSSKEVRRLLAEEN